MTSQSVRYSEKSKLISEKSAQHLNSSVKKKYCVKASSNDDETELLKTEFNVSDFLSTAVNITHLIDCIRLLIKYRILTLII